MLGQLTPFIVLLVVALIFQVIPMEPTFKRIGYIIVGVIALVLLCKFLGIF